MADLLVHLAAAAPAKLGLRDGRLRAILWVGVCLPDLLFKTLLYGFGAPTWFCEPSHSPLGLLPWCYAGALLFEEAWRARAFAALLGGAYLHLLVDLGKDYLGSGVLLWAFPFTMSRAELGWYVPEDTVYGMPAAAVLICLVEAVARRISGSKGKSGS